MQKGKMRAVAENGTHSAVIPEAGIDASISS